MYLSIFSDCSIPTYSKYAIHSVVCLATGPWHLPKQVPHKVWSSASSFDFQYPVISLRSSSSYLRLLPCLPITCILLYILPSITCFSRHFLCKMWLIQLAFLFIVLGYSFPPWLCVILLHFSHNQSSWSSPSFPSSIFQNFSQLSKFQCHSACSTLLFYSINLNIKPQRWFSFLVNSLQVTCRLCVPDCCDVWNCAMDSNTELLNGFKNMKTKGTKHFDWVHTYRGHTAVALLRTVNYKQFSWEGGKHWPT
jgi:hypothetical protein